MKSCLFLFFTKDWTFSLLLLLPFIPPLSLSFILPLTLSHTHFLSYAHTRESLFLWEILCLSFFLTRYQMTKKEKKMGPRLKLMLVVEAFWVRRKIPWRNVSNEKIGRNKRENRKVFTFREKGRKTNEKSRCFWFSHLHLTFGRHFQSFDKSSILLFVSDCTNCRFTYGKNVLLFFFYISLPGSVHDQFIHDLKITISEFTIFGFSDFSIRIRVQSYRIKCTTTRRLIFPPIQSFRFVEWSSIILILTFVLTDESWT